MKPLRDHIYVGDAVTTLSQWDDGSVDLCVTSPPYFGLRDFGHADQIGLEASVDEYLRALLPVLSQIKRVLKSSGALYLNLGDTFREKSLLGIPWRVALALMADGWYLRNSIIWVRPNPIPAGINDRYLCTYDHVFFLTKSKHYFFDVDPVRVPQVNPKGTSQLGNLGRPTPGAAIRQAREERVGFNPLGKKPADVWTIAPDRRAWSFVNDGEAGHTATYPEALCERPILASCPEGGLVLDPFMGSGTTAVVAQRLGRHFVGVELSPAYARMARARIDRDWIQPVPAKRSRQLFPTPSRPGTGKARIRTANHPTSTLTLLPDMEKAA